MDYLPALATIPGDRCAEPWQSGLPGGGELLQVRDGLYRCLEEELQAASEVVEMGAAARLLTGAQEAFGELRGILGPLPNSLLDKAPATGEWSLRETLRHILETEVRYRANTLHALGRGSNDPLVLPREQLPQIEAGEVDGTVGDVLERIALERRHTDAKLVGIPAALLTRPTRWAGFDVDVRFRLGRFAGHLVEHMVQVEKTLGALHHHPGEAALIARRISAARGRHEHHSSQDRLLGLDDHHREVLRSALAPLPAGGLALPLSE